MDNTKDILLDVRNLKTTFFTKKAEVKAVNDVSFHVGKKEVVAIVGESGCGKSVTQMSIMQLVQDPPGKIVGGEVFFDGTDILKLPRNSNAMRKIRGSEISMIFQEPMTSLNPVYTIGNQITEVIMEHSGLSKKEAWEKGVEALESVGIPEPRMRMKNFPFEMSGGMRQRVLIAIAVACGSKLIIADEPTTALDVTTQAQVMDQLMNVVQQHGTSVLMITHNLGLVTRYAERIYVMYAGKVVESGTTEEILTNPKHPYTKGLLNSVPRMDTSRSEKLIPIQGAPPDLGHLPDYCYFYPRCPYATDECKEKGIPSLVETGTEGHFCACHQFGKECTE